MPVCSCLSIIRYKWVFQKWLEIIFFELVPSRIPGALWPRRFLKSGIYLLSTLAQEIPRPSGGGKAFGKIGFAVSPHQQDMLIIGFDVSLHQQDMLIIGLHVSPSF